MALNLVNKYIDFVRDSSVKYAKLILDRKYNKELFLELLDTYINIRYYNDAEQKYNDISSNINYYLKKKAMFLLEKSDKPKNVIESNFYIFKFIILFDDTGEYNLEDVVNEIIKYKEQNNLDCEETFSYEFISLVKENNKKKKNFLKGFDTNRFNLRTKKTSKKNVYYEVLDFDIKFPRIYSSYSINKVFNNGLVNEDKLFILYYLVSRLSLNNAIKGIFNKEYIVDFPLTIIPKKEKLNRLFSILDSPLIKNSFVFKLNYKDYIANEELIKSWIKNGYKIAIILDDSFENNRNNEIWLDIFTYIIASKDKIYNNENRIAIEEQVEYGYFF